MKTKIVYVVTSSEKDCFLEQCWASAYTAKFFMPDSHIIILTDNDTKSNILSTKRKNILTVVDEIIDIEIPAEFGKMEKSRWLKTSMRKHISGDFLYIDCDTLIAKDLSEADNFDFSVGGVLDLNYNVAKSPMFKTFQKQYQQAFSIDFTEKNHYINSGVMYVKDDENARNLFEKWHKNWLISRKNNIRFDQPSLYKAETESCKITEINGVWNSQFERNMKYFFYAKILHFLGSRLDRKLLPFFGFDLYQKIKEEGNISPEIAEKITHFKQIFLSTPSTIIFSKKLKHRTFYTLKSSFSEKIFPIIIKLFAK